MQPGNEADALQRRGSAPVLIVPRISAPRGSVKHALVKQQEGLNIRFRSHSTTGFVWCFCYCPGSQAAKLHLQFIFQHMHLFYAPACIVVNSPNRKAIDLPLEKKIRADGQQNNCTCSFVSCTCSFLWLRRVSPVAVPRCHQLGQDKV